MQQSFQVVAALFKFQEGCCKSSRLGPVVKDWYWNCGLLIFFCGVFHLVCCCCCLFCFEVIKTEEDLLDGLLVCRVLLLPHNRSNIDIKPTRKTWMALSVSHESSSVIAGWSAWSTECIVSFRLLLLFVYLKSRLFQAAPSQQTNQDGTCTDLVLHNWLWLSLGNTTHVCLFLNALGEVKGGGKK